MVVLVVTQVASRVRGYARRYLIEVETGVFVGELSARVRQKLWQWIGQNRGGGSAILVYSAQTEQGYRIDVQGLSKREIFDSDGIQMSRILNQN